MLHHGVFEHLVKYVKVISADETSLLFTVYREVDATEPAFELVIAQNLEHLLSHKLWRITEDTTSNCTEDKCVLSAPRSSAQDETDGTLQGINVSLIGKSLAVCGELGTTRCGERQDGNNNALVNGEVRAIVFEVILEDDDSGRVDAARAGWICIAPRVKFGIKCGEKRAGIAQGFFLEASGDRRVNTRVKSATRNATYLGYAQSEDPATGWGGR